MAKNAQAARRVLTISCHAATDIQQTLHVPETKMTVTPLGYSTRAIPADPAVLAQESLAPRGYAMAFGALDERKNISMLLDLWAHVSMPCPLAVVGFEPKALAAAQRKYAGVGGLHLLGFEPDGRVRALLENAAMFLYPSFYEGFGLPVLEAMAASTPVVVAAGTAPEEVAGGEALAAPANSPEAWRAAIETLWTDRALWSRLSEGGPRVAMQHDWSETARVVLRVYRETYRETQSA